jgi:phosphoglycolate phosphatase
LNGIVIFDMDGTLVDTSGDIALAVNEVRAGLGHEPLAEQEVLDEVGYGAPYLLERTCGVDREADHAAELLGRFQQTYREIQGTRSKLYPGFHQALDTLRETHALFVLSNKPDPAVRRELERHSVTDYFEEIIGAGPLGVLKPDPVGIERFREKAGAPKKRTAMVGDMLVDMETAHKASVRSIFVTYGFGGLPAAPFPTAVADDLPQVAKIIQTWHGGGPISG